MRNFARLGAVFISLSAIGIAVADTSVEGISVRSVDYKSGDTVLEGKWVTAKTPSPKQAPGVLVIHDWLGATDKTVEKAKLFAGLGYQVFVADVYGKGIRPTREEAGKVAGLYKGNRSLFRQRLIAALVEMRTNPNLDSKRLAVVGYCFGGTGAVELARAGVDLNAVISFHGGLDSPTPSDGKNIKASILALHGADDPNVKAEDLQAFENEMTMNKVKLKLVKYPGAVHSFTDKTAGNDNSKGAAYNAKADAASWIEAKNFLKKTL